MSTQKRTYLTSVKSCCNLKVYYRYRCYSEKLSNLTHEEIKQIYSTYTNPSCSVINETESVYLPETKFINELPYTFDYLRSDDNNTTSSTCSKWIYKLDYGYHSMTSDVRL